MKQFVISLFLLLFENCLAPHFGCPKDRPFFSNTNRCGSFSDICIKYMSEECEFGIRACEQCPLSNLSSAVLDRLLRKMYGGEDKNCSQTRNETKSVQECSSNASLRSILFIVSSLLMVLALILLYFVYQFIRARKRRNHERSYFNRLSLGNQNDLDSVSEKLKKHKEIRKYFMMTKLEEIAKEMSILRNKMKSEKQIEISISWKDAENGFVPSGAIDVGNSCFIARAQHKREYIPGKLIPNDKCVYIGYGGQEISKSRYQVLVDTSILNKPLLEWKYACRQNIPLGAIIGGADDGKALYIAKDVNESKDLVGKFQPEHEGAYFPINNGEIYKKEPNLILCYSRL